MLLHKIIAGGSVIESIIKDFHAFISEHSLRRFSLETRLEKLFSLEEKQRIYAATKRACFVASLPEKLEHAGIRKYALMMVSGMAPYRIAIKDHSDLDMALLVEPGTHEAVDEAVRCLESFSGASTTKLGTGQYVVRFMPTAELQELGVIDSVDIFVGMLMPDAQGIMDMYDLKRNLYDLYRQEYHDNNGIVLSRSFSVQEERMRLERSILGRNAQTPGTLLKDMKKYWFDDISVDLYHLRLAGLDLGALGKLNYPDLSFITRVNEDPELSAAVQGLRNDIDLFRKEYLGFMRDVGDTKMERNMSYANWYVGNTSFIRQKIMDRVGALDVVMLRKIFERYAQLVCQGNPVGKLIAACDEDPEFGALVSGPIFDIFTESPEVIEKEFGIPVEYVSLILMADLVLKGR